MQKTVNVNGRKVNKLEEIIRLLEKLNKDHYTEEELEESGYPIGITLKADGSGIVYDTQQLCFIYRFATLSEAEIFLKANRREQLYLTKLNKKEENN